MTLVDDPIERRAKREAMFRHKRRTRTQQQAARSPLDRVGSADALRALWRPGDGIGTFRPTDEPIELWREIRARLRGSR